MGGVPILLALAVVGVDYGYQPDGDGGIDYIVQVSPEHWEQARDAGEITSVIDPSVRGRVNRIVIRIGEGELPRDAGSEEATPNDDVSASVSTAHALSPMPPPSEGVTNIRIAMADNDFVAIPELSGDAGPAAEALGARVMRPNPQSQQEEAGGFRLPGEQAGDDKAGEASKNEQQWPTQAELAATRSAGADQSGEQQASNEAARAPEDPLRRLSGGANAGNAGQSGSGSSPAPGAEESVQPPSTNPRSTAISRASETARPATQPRGSVAGRDDANWSESPPATRGPSTAYPRNDAPSSGGPPSVAADIERPTATPSRGFGAQPMSPVANSSSGYAQTNRGYAETPASPPDNRLAGYDHYGRPVNAAGELIPNANPAANRSPPTEPPPGRGYNARNSQEGYSDRYAMAGSPTERDRYQADAARLASESADVPQYGQGREPGVATTSEPSSPSDSQAATRKAEQEIAAQLAATRAALADADDAAENQSVVSQPVFNFLLLVSLVANAYLILQLSRLLQRYRNMVANMRSASTPTG